MNGKQQALYDKLTEDGFTITNIEDYKNVDSILSITCKNGHRQTDTVYNFQRNDWECIDCIN